MKPYFSKSFDEVIQELNSSSEGLSGDEAKLRLEKYGKNLIHEEKTRWWWVFFRQFHNFLVYILLAAGIISILIGEEKDFLVITIIILINGIIGFWQEMKANVSIEALKKLTMSQNQVMRDGKVEKIYSSELVPGDIVLFHEGELVTADIRLIETHGLMVNESSMTGESVPVIKDHREILDEKTSVFDLKNSLLAGTSIVRGSGKGIVVFTAEKTHLAKIAQKTQGQSPDSPFTKALSYFARRYVLLNILLFTTLGIIGLLQKRALLDLAYILLASLVSAAPEGLPIVITIVMVIGAMNLAKKKTLVRSLPSVETLGSANVICSDKTGTITTGNLIVKDVYATDLNLLKKIAVLCNDAREKAGDPLELALLEWAEEDDLRSKIPRKWEYAFDAKLMLMATLNTVENRDLLMIKGAYESLKAKAKEDNDFQLLDKKYEEMLEKGFRVLSFGISEFTGEDPDHWKIQIIGFIGFLDPAKEGVIDAVRSAKEAKIRVMMITGDHPKTARAIAQEVELFEPNDTILTGSEIEKMSDEDLSRAFSHTTVLARILPEHKFRIVQLLQKKKKIVAVTGDGVNDVPALRAADLGIAMGNGTESAKSVSDMVITDNNLSVIVEAIKNGRIIADNMRKIIYYLVSTSLQEIILISLAIFSSLKLPLSAIQILWINIVTDGTQDKTFAFIKEEGDVMQREPRDPAKQFFDLKQILRILTFGLFAGLAAFFEYLFLLDKYPFEMVSSLIFTSIVTMQWANSIQAQKEKEPFFKNIRRSVSINPYLYIGLSVGILLQMSVLYLFPNFFKIEPIPFELWKYPLILAVFAFFIVEIRKWIEWLFVKNVL